MAAICLAGCIPSKRENFCPEAEHPLEKIGLLSIGNPKTYDSVDIGNPEVTTKFIPLTHAGSTEGYEAGTILTPFERRQLFQNLLDAEKFAFSCSLTKALKDELKNAGYFVEDVPVTRKDNKKLFKNYELNKKDVDAYLDVVGIFVGYNCKSFLGDRNYKPRIIVYVNLIRSDDKKLLYSQLVNYGEKSTIDCLYLPINEKYNFDSFERLLDSKAIFLDGLNAGIYNIAKSIAIDLSKR